MADKALLVGINVYRDVNPLRGCENDVAQMRGVLVDTFGFPPNDVHTIVNANATKANIGQEMDWLLAALRPGDRALFHFSGHGSYVADTTGESEDGRDELICLYDMDFANPGSYFLDKELRRRFDPLPPGVLLVAFDSCHSGNGTRLIEAGPHLAAAAAHLQGAGLHPGRSLLVTADTLRRSKDWGQVVGLLGLAEPEVAVRGLRAALKPLEPA
jgi:uncharacterized caspase-like protein